MCEDAGDAGGGRIKKTPGKNKSNKNKAVLTGVAARGDDGMDFDANYKYSHVMPIFTCARTRMVMTTMPTHGRPRG